MVKLFEASYSLSKKCLLHPTNFSINKGELLVIMGANGAGKSTLIKLISGLLKPSSGSIDFLGKELGLYSINELAKKRAVLTQRYDINFALTSREIIMMGRYPFFNSNPSSIDESIVDATMRKMEITHLANRFYQTLSGGEAQKVQMCRVLAQIESVNRDSTLLLLDEPVAHLDLKFQYQLLAIVKSLALANTTVVSVLHDINLALKYADRILFLKKGKVEYLHYKKDKITAAVIKNVFDVDAKIIHLPDDERQWVTF